VVLPPPVLARWFYNCNSRSLEATVGRGNRSVATHGESKRFRASLDGGAQRSQHATPGKDRSG
jgi:hypothetical protein